MKFYSLVLLGLLMLIPLAVQRAVNPTPAAIEGVVRDSNGNTLPEASVYAVDFADIRRRFETTTDLSGRFMFRDLPSGNYSVHAYKESAGYPDSFFSFFTTSKKAWQRVEVENDRTSDVVIELGPKYATLNLSVQDELGTAVDGVSLTFIRDDDPKRPYSVGSNSSAVILVPPVPFRLKVEAKGYKQLSDRGDTTSGDNSLVINPRSGETLSVTARLKRSSRSGR